MNIKVKETPGVALIEQPCGIDGVYEQIEVCGRNCYRSTPKGGDSAKKFTEAMISSGHYAMLEHGTVYLAMPVQNASDEPHKIVYNKYTKAARQYIDGHNGFDFITTNYRVLVENDWLDLLQYWTVPTKYHERRITVMFDTNIGISREFNRHRVNSVAESSTRYCNYTKNKFDGALTVIEPTWLRDRAGIINMKLKNESLMDKIREFTLGQDSNWEKLDYWLFALEVANVCYQRLIELGCKPQEAREVLPLATNTQLIHTAFVEDWKHFFELRAEDTPTNHPHPMALELAAELKTIMIKHGYI